MREHFTQTEIDAFVQAACFNNGKEVTAWLGRGMPPDALNNLGRSALFEAAQQRFLPMVRRLLKAKANPNLVIYKPPRFGIAEPVGSPLHAACEHGAHKIIAELLKWGADPRILTNNHMTAAHCLIKSWTDYLRFKKDQADKPDGPSQLIASLGSLIDAGVAIDQLTADKTTLLSAAIGNGLPLRVVQYLLERGANPNRAISDGTTAMHHAVAVANISAIRLLAAAGGRVDAPDDHGRPPLFYFHAEEAAQALLDLGADIRQVDNAGADALVARIDGSSSASLLGPVEQVAFLLKAGANAEHTDYAGRSARSIAKSRGHADIESLIDATLARQAMRQAVSRTLVIEQQP